MLIDFVAFFAKLIIALTLLKLAEIWTLKSHGEDSSIGQALAFLAG